VEARTARADHLASVAEQALENRQEALRRRAQSTQEELEAARRAMTLQGIALERERRGRAEAEQRAQTALESLRDIATVTEDARGTVISVPGEVLFASGHADLLPASTRSLSAVAEAMKEIDPNTNVIVVGHTDSTGPRDLNERLSVERAQAVRGFLASHGVDAARIAIMAKASSEPVASNDTPEGRANNRRVEIVIAKVTAPAQPGHTPPPLPPQEKLQR
jgi:outer membrane protein OmpA-like peptidoglycan-associated protein